MEIGENRTSTICKIELPSKKLTRIAKLEGADYFFIRNDSFYYTAGSMTTDPSVYRLSLDGKTKQQVSPTVLDTQDQRYRYYIGHATAPQFGLYFPLMRQPLPLTGETYIEDQMDTLDYDMERRVNRGEQLSTLEFDMTDYIGEPDSDAAAFVEREQEGGWGWGDTAAKEKEERVTYLHLFHHGDETIRKITGWEVELLDILHGVGLFYRE